MEEAYIACGEDERDECLYCLLAKHPGVLHLPVRLPACASCWPSTQVQTDARKMLPLPACWRAPPATVCRWCAKHPEALCCLHCLVCMQL